MLLSPIQSRELLARAARERFALLAVNADSPAAITDVLEAAVAEVAVDVTKKFDPDGLLIQDVRVEENNGHVLWEKPLRALQERVKLTEKKKK